MKKTMLIVFLYLILFTSIACTKTNSSNESLTNEGKELFNKRKYSESITRFEKAVEAKPDDYLNYSYLSKAFVREAQTSGEWDKGLLEKALNSAKKAVELDNNSSDALTTLGNAYVGLGKYEAALKSYEQAITINNDFGAIRTDYNINPLKFSKVDCYLALAFIYGSQDKMDLSIENYQKALVLNPSNPYIYYNMGRTYYQNKNLDEAIENYNKAIELEANDPGIYNDLGKAYTSLDKFDLAEKNLNKAISLNSKYANAYYNLGLLYEKKNELEKALEYQKKAQKLDPNNYLNTKDIIKKLEEKLADESKD